MAVEVSPMGTSSLFAIRAFQLQTAGGFVLREFPLREPSVVHILLYRLRLHGACRIHLRHSQAKMGLLPMGITDEPFCRRREKTIATLQVLLLPLCGCPPNVKILFVGQRFDIQARGGGGTMNRRTQVRQTNPVYIVERNLQRRSWLRTLQFLENSFDKLVMLAAPALPETRKVHPSIL
jgi:hypothetical protein